MARLFWSEDANAKFVGDLLSPTPFLRDREVAERWKRGRVRYLAIEGDVTDWRAEERVKLWRYERQYHRELVVLAALAAVEPDGDWLTLAVDAIQSWRRACPPLEGDAWEPYPVARRIINWSLAGCLAPSLAPHLAPLLALHLRFMSRHLERHLLGNHFLCDAAALVCGAAVLDGSSVEQLGARGMSILESELERQLLADGGYGERTVQYHALVLFDSIAAVGLWQRRGHNCSQRLRELLDRMAAFLGRVRRDDGSFPWVNDAAPDSTPPLAQLSELSSALGLRLPGFVNAEAGDFALAETGWQFVRSGHHELLFDVGVIGPPEQPGHGHSDALAFELRWDGDPIVVDTGVSTYESDSTRVFERSTRAHATVTVDDLGPDELWAAFRVGARGRPHSEAPRRSGNVRVLHGTVDAAAGWRHQRTLVYWPTRLLLVDDRVTRFGRSVCRARLPLAPGVILERDRLTRGNRAPLRWQVLRGEQASVEPGWMSRGFGNRIARQVLVVRCDASGRAVYSIGERDTEVSIDERGVHLRHLEESIMVPIA